MNYPKKFLPVLLALLLLLGCTKEPSSAIPEFSQAPQEAATEPSTEAPKKRPLSAEDIYWRSRFAAGTRASAYSSDIQLDLRVGSAGVYVRTNMSLNNRIIMSEKPCAVNVESELYYTMLNVEVEQTIRQYFREENGRLIQYYDLVEMDMRGREDMMLEDVTPYIIILEYTATGYPAYLPEDLVVAEETQILDEREVYALSYTMTPVEILGVASEEATDPALLQMRIPVQWYVDAETMLPVEISYQLDEIEALLTPLILAYTDIDFYLGTDSETEIEINTFTYRCCDMVFEKQEVPPIPEDILTDAKKSAGYTGL